MRGHMWLNKVASVLGPILDLSEKLRSVYIVRESLNFLKYLADIGNTAIPLLFYAYQMLFC